ncbi:TPA: hypothetical protein QDB45_001632 [Burkholderia vietnamiensis]|nr:hypothetical protein [Burkholderia vietnamiensis]
MSNLFSIRTLHNEIRVRSPFNPNFVRDVKQTLSGEWRSGEWVFDARNEEVVRKLVKKHFGYEDGVAFVSVKLTYNTAVHQDVGQPIVNLGRCIAQAHGRDTGAEICKGVAVVAGSITSGGSMRNPSTVITEGTTVLIHDIPEPFARGRQTTMDPEKYTLEIIESAKVQTRREWLVEEQARLKALLSEVEKDIAAIDAEAARQAERAERDAAAAAAAATRVPGAPSRRAVANKLARERREQERLAQQQQG